MYTIVKGVVINGQASKSNHEYARNVKRPTGIGQGEAKIIWII